MGLGPRLDLRQSQSLVMTPQLQQAIRLLALSNLEIESFIAEEFERNPLLDTGGGDEAANADEIELPRQDGEAASLDTLLSSDGTGDAPLDVDYNSEDFHQDSAADRMQGPEQGLGMEGFGSAGASGEALDFDSFAGGEASLHEYLLAQAGTCLSGTDLVIATQIIEQIEETGYFHASLLELAQRLGAPLSDVERVLAIVQTFDPPGIAARSLAECLALQAKDANRYDPAMARLIDNLDYLAKGNLPALKRICGVDDEDLGDMIRELRAYDPKPGCKFQQGGEANAVTPDVFVGRRANGWAIELNSATLPKLLVNRTYYVDREGSDRDRKAAGRLLPERSLPSPPAHASDGRGCDRDARIDRQPRHIEQISRLRPGPVRAQIFLHQRHSEQ
jgi:RNA polymerase sigma-54 factor